MSPRLAVLVGLLAGIMTSGVLVLVVYLNALSIASTLWPSASTSPDAGGLPSSSPVGSPSPVSSPGASLRPGASPSPSGPSPSATGSAASPGASASVPETGFLIGQPAPRLVLPLLGGGTIDLSTLKGKPVWVNFMATYCPSCRDEFPVMNGFAARYADTGLVVLAVDVQEDDTTIATFARDLNVTFPIALDRDGAAERIWKAVALPIHFWIDARGIVRFGALGGTGRT
jgi:thiol-disulfide isomerase/thioredoxin